MKKGWLASIGLLVFSVSLAADTDPLVTRDWTIERPLFAGFLFGVSFGGCRACALGAGEMTISGSDPFAMTPAVREELLVLAKGPNGIGTTLGFLYSTTILSGLFLRGMNTLRSWKPKEIIA